MFFPDAAVVEWSDDESSALITLRGQNFQRRKSARHLVLEIDGAVFEIVDLDSSLVTTNYATGEELLSKHRQWEVDYWKRTLGVPVEAHIEEIAGCECTDASLWQIAWPEGIRAARQVSGTNQLYLTFIAGRRIVVVSSTVVEGQSVADRLAYLTGVARDARIWAGPINQEELRRWLKENGWEVSPSESDPG